MASNGVTALDDTFKAPHETHEHIDDTLRAFLALTSQYKRMRQLYTGLYEDKFANTRKRNICNRNMT